MIWRLAYVPKWALSPTDRQKDNAPSNNATAKISDFGISTHIELLANHTKARGTLYFCHPEVLKQSTYQPTSDIYSLGVVYYHLLTLAESPFGSVTSSESED